MSERLPTTDRPVRRTPLGDAWWGRVLGRILEPLYRLGLAYDQRRMAKAARRRLPVPVISIGNLTVGGTGKTPVVEAIARAHLRRGGTPGILSRGYKGKKNAQNGQSGNDEFALLARRLPGVPHVADRERSAGGMDLLRQHPTVDLILLDDGFQHRVLDRDLDLVLIDATHPFGGGHCLPAGWCREPWTALERADAILITRGEQISPGARQELFAFLKDQFPDTWLGISKREVEGYRDARRGDVTLTSLPEDGPITAFCGIGNPEAFFASLSELDVPVVAKQSFRDHHDYTAADLDRLRAEARRCGAVSLLTTEKDGVKLEALPNFADPDLPVIQVRMKNDLDGDAILQLLAAQRSR